MKKYKNDNGCSAEFDDDIPDEVVNQRLSWLGKNWVKVE